MFKYSDLTEPAKLFIMPERNPDEIEKAGNQALSILYGYKPELNLNDARTSKFTEKVVLSSEYLPPKCLPPTSDAARFHSQRIYLQVHCAQCKAWLENNIEPTKWGWVLHKSRNTEVLQPLRMEQAAAPASLLKIIRCNCTGKCDRNTCSCRKNGLLCTLACGHCKGNTCTNAQRHDASDDVD